MGLQAKNGICPACGEQFRPVKGKIYCSPRCRYASWAETPPTAQACTYCGIPADTIDHVPPQSARPAIIEIGLRNRWPFEEVISCRECNLLLGARALWTVKSRKAFIKKALARRYKKYLRIPSWTDAEIARMGRGLQDHVLSGIVIRELVNKRLKW